VKLQNSLSSPVSKKIIEETYQTLWTQAKADSLHEGEAADWHWHWLIGLLSFYKARYRFGD